MIFIQSIKFMYPDVFTLGVYEFNVMLDIMLANYIIFHCDFSVGYSGSDRGKENMSKE